MNDPSPSLVHRLHDFLRRAGSRPMKAHDLAAHPEIGASARDVRQALRELERTGKAKKIRGNRWVEAQAPDRVAGRLLITFSGYGIVITDPPDSAEYFIPPSEIGSCMEGDRVEVSPAAVRPRAGQKQEAHLIRVVERKIKQVAGKLVHGRYYAYVIPGDPRMRSTLHVSEAGLPPDSIPDGDIVVVALDEPVSPDRSQTSRLIQHLGAPGDPGVDMQMLMANRGIVQAFEPGVVDAAQAISPTPDASAIAGREDLRDWIILTIDPSDAKDYDDAISLTRTGDGWELGVHIADVSHFVTPGSAIDTEAKNRGNSVYMVDRFVPMLPKYLTSEVCSLRASVDRLAYSVHMTLDADGELESVRTGRSVIHSKACLNYDQVQRFLSGEDAAEIPESLHPTLRAMDKLATRLRRKRMANGSIDLSLPEVVCTLDDQGTPISLKRRGAAQAYHLIEEFMLLANCAVAERIRAAGVPGVYRIHEEPSEDQWAQMNLDVRNLGIAQDVLSRQGIDQVCALVRDTPQEYAVNLAILKNFKRAIYSIECLGHFGLAFDCYTHFTSPIRRYPDLLVHRILDRLDTRRKPAYSANELEVLCLHATETERNAQAAEQESLEIKRLQFYQLALQRGDIGPYPALVVGVAAKGLLLELVESLQRGFLSFDTLPRSGHYRVARDQGRVYGGQSKVLFTVGDVLDVAIAKVDEGKRQVEFVPWKREGTRSAEGREKGKRQDRGKSRGQGAGRNAARGKRSRRSR
ncbi:MAG: VacB/RNase II family 3'-5' exoribonuclease [Verrucomicrobia bacterium]|nr:VacB/RNase II family 3'-5' exoribonuclease [Verrucomicrobiota bacterium]